MRWAHQLATTTPDVFGCVPGDVNCGDACLAPTSTSARRRCSSPRRGGRDLIVAGQKSGVVYALDPDKRGQQVWRYRAGGGSGLGGIQWGIATDGTRVYAPVAEIYDAGTRRPARDRSGDRRARVVRAAAAPLRVRETEPRLQRRAVLGRHGDPRRRLLAVERRNAVRAFSTPKPVRSSGSSTPIANFTTVNGVKAKGGSMNGPAPVVAGGMLYVSSGYGAFGLRPGNVLVALGLD